MNSTATESSFTRRRAMRGIVKVFVMWTLGLAVLFGSSAVGLAQPKLARGPQCSCTCWYGTTNPLVGPYGLGVLTFSPPKPNSCVGFTSFDRYFACKDKAGNDQAGLGYGGCTYNPGVALPPLQRAPAR